MILSKKCLICKGGKKNDCIYWHKDESTGDIWCYCTGKCQRGYSIFEYCHEAGISLSDLLKSNLTFEEAQDNRVNAIAWPRKFVGLSDPLAKEGVEYLRSRMIEPANDMYFDHEWKGIVFPYYYENTFVGAQIRLINPWRMEDGDEVKITTLPGTRLGYLFYGWNQGQFLSNIKAIIVTEGALNSISLQQALNKSYGGMLKNPFKCIATSGSGLSDHQAEKLKDITNLGYKVIAAPDNDEAGLKMLDKLRNRNCCTHYALVDEDGKDWNDLLKADDVNLSEYFLKRVRQS